MKVLCHSLLFSYSFETTQKLIGLIIWRDVKVLCHSLLSSSCAHWEFIFASERGIGKPSPTYPDNIRSFYISILIILFFSIITIRTCAPIGLGARLDDWDSNLRPQQLTHKKHYVLVIAGKTWISTVCWEKN